MIKITVSDDSMVPYVKAGDEVEAVEGKPHPNGRICVVKFNFKTLIREVFREYDIYTLKPLNPKFKTNFVLVAEAEIFLIRRRIPVKRLHVFF